VEATAVKEVTRRARGPSVAWVTLFGALIGVTALVPIFPYVGGGGYVPLAVPFAAIAPFLLGPWGGVVASIIGGLIGMFIAPGGFPLGLLDVLLTTVLPAFFVALFANGERYWALNTLCIGAVAVMTLVFPYYLPGAAAGFETPPQPLYWALSAYYWLPPLLVAATPLGSRLVPGWLRGQDRGRRYLGIFVTVLASLLVWWLPWTRPYWYLFKYPAALAIATFIGYTWWVPVLSLITAVITMPLVEALARTGLPKVERALW